MLEIRGALREINLEEHSFRIYRTARAQLFVLCRYGPQHEPVVKKALDRYIAVTGQATGEDARGQIREVKVEGIEMLGEPVPGAPADEAAPKRRCTARDLLASGLVGIWRDRRDVRDSRSFARALRERAQQRCGE